MSPANTPSCLRFGVGFQPAEILSEAKFLARQTGHPVGVRRLCSGATDVTVLKTEDLLKETFDTIVQPGDAASAPDVERSA